MIDAEDSHRAAILCFHVPSSRPFAPVYSRLLRPFGSIEARVALAMSVVWDGVNMTLRRAMTLSPTVDLIGHGIAIAASSVCR